MERQRTINTEGKAEKDMQTDRHRIQGRNVETDTNTHSAKEPDRKTEN